MKNVFHNENRESLLQHVKPGSLVLLFSGHAPRKTGDEDYPFFADRSFVYYTGIEQADSVYAAIRYGSCGSIGNTSGNSAQVKTGHEFEEMLFMLPPDAHAERWTGKRLKAEEAEERSAIRDFRYNSEFLPFLERQIAAGIHTICLDFDRKSLNEQPVREAFQLAAWLQKHYPYVKTENLHDIIRNQRTIKKPCEIEAMRYAEQITAEGIKAMMRASRAGMYEYQYKAEFDYALAQRGVLNPGFPSIISAGENNFCIHYYSYRGQAQDGDMVLNDVGACWDNEINDVSRGWPVNGRFSERQALLYTCAYNTSNYMFDILKPGLPMAFVDQEIRRYNFEQLKAAGVCHRFEDIGTYMWHGGAHHVGYDVHDEVDVQNGKRPLEPGMVFCIDVGIYHEEWGIGFRLEDNCLITPDGCENLSVVTPRSIEDIEAFMGTR